MTKDIAKELEEQARMLQESTLSEEAKEKPKEEETEELYEVYDKKGEKLFEPLSALDQYDLCIDDTRVDKVATVIIDSECYNPFTETIEEDRFGNYWIRYRNNTYRHVLCFDSEGNYDSDITEILSVNTILDMGFLYITNPIEALVLHEDLMKYGYEVENTVLVKKKDKKEIISEFKEALYKQYPYFESTITSIYGDNWDINYHEHFQSECIIIKFSEVTITNASRQTHLIKDLYILLPMLRSTMKFNGTMFGGRGLMSNVEITSNNYGHSHLSAQFGSVGQFCLGTGPINGYFLDFNRKPSENSLFSLLYNVRIYAEWESVAGVPYKKIADIGKGELRSDESYYLDFVFYFGKYLKQFTLPLVYKYQNGRGSIMIDERIIEKQLLKLFPGDRVFRDNTTGKYFEQSMIENISKKHNKSLLNFKGEEIYTQSYNVKEINIQDTEYVVHPKITKRFIENAIRRVRDYYFYKIAGIDKRKGTYYYI